MATIGRQVRNGVIAGGVLAIALVIARSHAGSGDAQPVPETPLAPMATIAPMRESKPAETPQQRLRLPPQSIDITKLLGRTRSEIERVLGTGTLRKDGRVSFDRGTSGNVLEQLLVRFERGKAVSFDIPGARGHFEDLSESDKDAVGDWFGAREANAIGGREYRYGNSEDGIGYGAFDALWGQRFDAEVQRETKARIKAESAAADEARAQIAVRLTKLMHENGIDDLAFQAKGTTMNVINLTGGGCRADDLRQLLPMLPGFKEGLIGAGFRELRCSPEGDEIPID